MVLLAVAGAGACGGKDKVEPPAELISFEATLDVRQAWRRKVGSGSERLRLGLAPASDGTRVFVGALDGTAAAISLEDGKILWETETDLSLSGGPSTGGGLVVFGTRDGILLALDAESGDERWRFSVGSEILAAPTVSGNAVMLRTVDGRLSAVAAATGRENWAVLQSQPALTLRGSTSPLVVGNVVVAGFDNGRVGAYNVADGVSRWEFPLSNPSGRSEIERLVDVSVDIEVFGNDVYAANFQGRAVAIDLTAGVVLWEHSLSSFTGLGLDTQHVYVTDDVSTVIALNRLSGVETWRQDDLRLRDVTAASRHRDAVVVADYQGYVHWLNAANGNFMARARGGSAQIYAQPLVVGQTVVTQAEDGTVAAFRVIEPVLEPVAGESG